MDLVWYLGLVGFGWVCRRQSLQSIRRSFVFGERVEIGDNNNAPVQFASHDQEHESLAEDVDMLGPSFDATMRSVR